jgi:putative oxidoreductase
VETGLLILRVVVGLTLAAHGAQKLFGWFGGPGLTGTGQFFVQMGFRPGRLQAALAGTAELGGGLFLVAGLLTPAVAAAAVAVMFVAMVSVHLKNGFFVHNGGYEFTLVLGGAALTLAFTGPGALSLDRALGISWSGDAWGLAALATGLAGGAVPLLSRRTAQTSTAPDTAQPSRA